VSSDHLDGLRRRLADRTGQGPPDRVITNRLAKRAPIEGPLLSRLAHTAGRCWRWWWVGFEVVITAAFDPRVSYRAGFGDDR